MIGNEILFKFLELHFGKRGVRTVACLVMMVFGITLNYLPTYSPNLNLIEWGYNEGFYIGADIIRPWA